MIDPETVKLFLAEYRDLVHRHDLGLGIEAVSGALKVTRVTDPDAHVAEIADERPSEIAKGKAKGKA